MKPPGVPRALLVAGGLVLVVVAGIGTAGSFGDGGELWGDGYDAGAVSGDADRGANVLRAPAIRATIDSMRSVLREALVDGEPGTAAQLYAEDAVYVPAMAPPVRGRGAVRAHLEDEVPNVTEVTVRNRDVRVLSPGWATEEATVVIHTGSESIASTVELRRVLLFRKTDDGWKISRDVGSLNDPPGTGQ